MDRRLRELQRQAALGDREAQTQLLRRRLQLGELSPDRLRLGAYLGEPRALALLGDEAPATPLWVKDWLRGLHQWGREAVVRAACAAARRVLPLIEGQLSGARWVRSFGLEAEVAGVVDAEARVRRTLEAAEAWCDCPCEEHVQEARWAREQLEPALRASTFPRPREVWLRRPFVADPNVAAGFAAVAAAEAARLVAARLPRGEGNRGTFTGEDAIRSLLCLDPALRPAHADVRAAVRAALLPWALGEAAQAS